MKIKIVVCVMIVALSACLSPFALAAPEKGQFFFGVGYGEASLNNDVYIYSAAGIDRQPELSPKQSNRWEGPNYSVYVGQVIGTMGTGFLGSSSLSLAVQGGYTDMGKYTISVEYGCFPDDPGYRSIEEQAADLLLTSTLYWENGFNIFAKAGIARFQGRYEQEGLRSPRQPEYDPAPETYTLINYRPEVAAGIGFILSDRVNIHLQYASILGEKASTKADRFGNREIVELPNTLYKADSLTLGATIYW